MARINVEICPRCKRSRGERHKATTKRPTLATMERWVSKGLGKATDGCGGIELDSECEHGHQSWVRVLGLI